ncbi:MAG TPA: ROK family protein [Terriglobia bacterium]|nr:ROK family protein [Terriglobia bacterium]
MHYLGVDIGGTAIKAGLSDESGIILKRKTTPTPATDLVELVSTLKTIFTGFQTEAPIAAAGVGVPGLVSSKTGQIVTSPHVPCLNGVDLGSLLAGEIGVPVTVDNDANAGAYGEFACGAGKGLRHMAYVTLGTGLGAGLIVDGRLFRGGSGYAGEMGHIPIELDGRPCDCGSQGCVETWVSATGMVQTAEDLLAKSPASALHGIRRAEGSLTAEAIYRCALDGDAVAERVFEMTGRYLGMASAILMNLLNLETIVVGGGVMAAGPRLLEPAIREARRRAFAASFNDCPIVQSLLWPDAGVAGAAMIARDHVAQPHS